MALLWLDLTWIMTFRPSTLVRPLAIAFAALVSVAACSPLGTLNAVIPSGSYTISADVAYGPLARQRLDIDRPSSTAPAAGWPVVVFFYGGSWNRGEKADYKFAGEALASRGVLTLVADYRLYPEVRYPDFLKDSASALGYGLQEAARLGGDPKRVFVMGHSAGGYNAAMLALDARWLGEVGRKPSELAGFIGLAGPYEFLPMTNPDAQPVFFHPNYPPNTQPIEFASAAAPRIFLGAALKDNLIDPQRNTVALAAKLQAAGAPVTLKMYDRVNHMTLVASLARPLRFLAPTLDDVVAFIDAERTAK
jgi:acetyl esterase/lipase